MAQAQNVYWGDPAQIGTGSTSYDWMTAAEWSPNTNGPLSTYGNSGVTASSTVFFIGDGTNTITVNTAENTSGGSYPSQIHIGDVGANDNAVITLNYNQGTAGLLRCSGYLGVGWSAPDAQSICTAIFNVNANVNVTGSGINVGRFGSVGILNLNAGTLTCSGVFSMANGVTSGSTNAGQATLNINAGTLTGVTTFTIGAAGAANAVPVSATGMSGSNTVAHATVNINGGTETQTSSGSIIFCNGNNTMGTLNLNGGQMIAGNISKGTGKTNTLATFNFNGGTLVANKSSITFMSSGFDAVNVLSGGAFINTSNFNITIGSNLQDGGGGGGLTLSGMGMLTLSGTNNTYTGPTIINSGALLASGLNGTTLVMVGSNTFGAYGNITGPVLVGNNGTLTAFQTGTTLSMASLILGTAPSDTITMNFTANGATPLGNYAIKNSGGLTNNGTCTVNLSGVIFPETVPNTNTLITYNGARNGSGIFVLGATPGVQGYLLDTGTAIDLVITNYTALTWVGSPANTWDTLGELVWQNAGVPVSFANGDEVYFDDTAASFNVNVGSGVNPGATIISSSSNYMFSGSSLTSANPFYVVGPGATTLTTPGNSLSALNLDGGTLQLPGSDTVGTLNLAGGTLQVLGSDTVTTYNWTSGTIQIDNGGNSGLLNLPATTIIPSDGAVIWDRSDSVISTVSFSGAGSFEQIGGGNLTLTAASPLTGAIIVSNGTLTLDAASTFSVGSGLSIQANGVVDCLAVNALGSGGSGVTIQPTTINAGGLLTCDGNSGHVYFNKLTLNGGVLDSGSDSGDQYGTFACSPGSILVTANSTISAVNMSMVQTVLPITINNGVTLTVSGYWADTQSGGSAGTYAGIPYLTLIGPGKVVFTAGQTYTGDTTITNGAVVALNNGAFLDSSNIVMAGGTMDVTGQSDDTLHLQDQPSPGTGPYNFGQSLLGTGTILGNLDAGNNAVTVAPGGDSWAGTPGTINVSGSITLGGTTRMELNRGGNPNCDRLASLSSINYGGALVVTNIGSQLHAGDTFTLFNAAAGYNGSSFSSIVLPNYYTWDTSQLAVNGSISVVTTLPPPVISDVGYSQVQNGILTFNALNGAAGGSYTLLTSTNLALPFSQWTTVATGNFDGSGNLTGLSITNTVGAQRFYILSAQ
ncbi:MAG TPA: autotransporter-associated beta strand repeat-containing protein [Verrucomicrobiae bacterium]|nr:autotransporter-associated beta strand repeat-containing protein [Verrucomicrobiae bacterium]